ncbi:hypothetical protein [Streptococcus equi]|nr:hypothetical protein [Streptococcus equi]VED85980.1 Uncharacterised protein [Streptococcus equi subsp. equi]KIS17011.1 hypothetical protein AT49_00831 [Streptococcus equi subsp. zooepidemicus SzAM35]MDI5954736.1 hypothetical protein [Streptococcus equi subsp. zooepidemicus]MDI6075181.1 hypothetical protein [Streptococcus equi subsp. zooepidemicus]QTZ59276.1 hypothetical protein MCPGFBBE_01381 [Streptococcus equi subsp. zooepidemicus]
MVVQEIREHDFDQELDLTFKNLVCGGFVDTFQESDTFRFQVRSD